MIRKKQILAKGSNNVIYNCNFNNKLVIRVGCTAVEDAIKFLRFPNLCPIVHKIGNSNYAIVEKLTLQHRKDIDLNCILWISKTKLGHSLYQFREKEHVERLKYYLESETQILLLERLHEIITKTGMRDIHRGNFGYDKYGNLKALDL